MCAEREGRRNLFHALGAVVLPNATVTSETPHIDNLDSGSHGPWLVFIAALGPFCRERAAPNGPAWLAGWSIRVQWKA